MTRTTPDRPFDLEALFPELTEYARTATRLHPRSGAPTVHESSVGGPLLWPADEPWPTCPDSHAVYSHGVPGPETVESIRRERGTWSAAADAAERSEQEGALVAIAQLYTRDIPDLKAPPGADVLQVLWCPFDHSTGHGANEGPAVTLHGPNDDPAATLRWRDSSAVGELLDAAPEPATGSPSRTCPRSAHRDSSLTRPGTRRRSNFRAAIGCRSSSARRRPGIRISNTCCEPEVAEIGACDLS